MGLQQGAVDFCGQREASDGRPWLASPFLFLPTELAGLGSSFSVLGPETGSIRARRQQPRCVRRKYRNATGGDDVRHAAQSAVPTRWFSRFQVAAAAGGVVRSKLIIWIRLLRTQG